MQLYHEGYTLRSERVESHSETIERLRRWGGRFISASWEDASEFWLLMISDAIEAGVERGLGIGVASSTCGPCVLPLPGQPSVLIGLNCSVACLALPPGDEPERWTLELGVPFHSFSYKAGDPNILVLFETGVLALSEAGVERWRFDFKDVMCLARVGRTHVSVSYMEGEQFEIDRMTGRSRRSVSG